MQRKEETRSTRRPEPFPVGYDCPSQNDNTLQDGDCSSWEEFHKFATSFRNSAANAVTTVSDYTVFDPSDHFINKHEVEPFRGRGHMMLETGCKDVRLMDHRTQRELKRSNIVMCDPDLDTIKTALRCVDLRSDPDPEEPSFERTLPTKISSHGSPGQYDDAESDSEPSFSLAESVPRRPRDFHDDETELYVPSDPTPYRASSHHNLDQTAYDAFNYIIDESDFIKVDPSSLPKDNPTPSPCSSPLPDGELPEETLPLNVSPVKTDPCVPVGSSPSEASDKTAYYDAFNYKIDESDFIKVDPISLNMDASALSPSPENLENMTASPEEIAVPMVEPDEPKTDDVDDNPPATAEAQLPPDIPSVKHAPNSPELPKLSNSGNDRLRDLILSIKNALSEHKDVLTRFLGVVSAWTSEEITYREMVEKLTRLLSDSFPDLLDGFLNFTKDTEFPDVLVTTSVKPRRNYRNFVVMNYWKKEEQQRNIAEENRDGKADTKDSYISIIRECVSKLCEEAEVSKEQVQTADEVAVDSCSNTILDDEYRCVDRYVLEGGNDLYEDEEVLKERAQTAAEMVPQGDLVESDGSKWNNMFHQLLRIHTAQGWLIPDID